MPLKIMKSIFFSAALMGVSASLVPADAQAAAAESSALEVTFEELEDRVIIHIRDPGGPLSKPDIMTSRRGYMLSFPDEQVATAFHRTNAWRLGRLQTQQYGDRAVVRLEQRRYRPSPIEDNVKIERVIGGMDITVEENKVMPALEPAAAPVPATPAATPAATSGATPAETPQPRVKSSPLETSDATIDALQRKLGGEVPTPTPDLSGALAANTAANTDAPGAPADPAMEVPDQLPTTAENDAPGNAPEPLFAGDDNPSDATPAGTPLFGDAAGDPLNDPFEDGRESTAAAAASAAPFGGSGTPGDMNRFAMIMIIPSILGVAMLALWNRRRQSLTPATARMEVMSKISLGPKQQVVQVKVGGRELLLGVTEHQVGLISDVTSALTAPTAAPDLLAGAFGGISGAASAPSTAASASPNAASASPNATAGAASSLDLSPDRLDAFKSRLSAALQREVRHNDAGERGQAAKEQQIDDLRRVLSGAGDRREPAWATVDEEI